ncbi:MAG TPA: cupin domain-containing protein [Gammaproteobacteria bacterium]|nr:cupin domain-containing protein [Gammaproteobacteria bacterium]
MNTDELRIENTAAVLQPDLSVRTVPLTGDFYAALDRDFDGFRGRWLFVTYSFSEAWGNWERHPAGDEIVYLLEGDVEMILETPEGERRVHLDKPGSYAVVPRNTWHTARPRAMTRMLFITPGEGTEHRPA